MSGEPTQKDIREINYRMEDVEKSVGLLLKARRQEVIADLMENCFRRSIEKIRVFMAIDGESSVNDIANKLGMKSPNVSRHIRDFLENDLIKMKDTEGAKIIYEKTSQVRRLRLDKYLVDNFREELEKASEKGESGVEQGTSQGTNAVPSP
jgi:DNA-binding MarR family transcriptional regulator